MQDRVALVDGWEIRPREDGGFGVYDAHGLIDGPYGTKEEAMNAASRLPRHAGSVGHQMDNATGATGSSTEEN